MNQKNKKHHCLKKMPKDVGENKDKKKNNHKYEFRLKENDWECIDCGDVMPDHGDMF